MNSLVERYQFNLKYLFEAKSDRYCTIDKHTVFDSITFFTYCLYCHAPPMGCPPIALFIVPPCIYPFPPG